MHSTELLVTSLVGLFLPLFCIVDLQTSNGLMPAAVELMMLSRQLIMPCVEHAVHIIGIDLCLPLVRPRESMVLNERTSRIMNAPGII